MSAANLPYLMTVAEFLDWPTPDGSDRWELVDGVPMAMAPASDRHGIIHAQAVYLLAGHLADSRPDCRVIVEPGTKPDDHNLRIPDLTVTCGPIPPPGDPAARFSNPVLVVEILSPSNWRKTMRNRRQLCRDRRGGGGARPAQRQNARPGVPQRHVGRLG